jgi:hypothetical protein
VTGAYSSTHGCIVPKYAPANIYIDVPWNNNVTIEWEYPKHDDSDDVSKITVVDDAMISLGLIAVV